MSDDWKPNPLTHVFPLAIGLFGWQVHGIIIGIVLGVVHIGITIFSNKTLLDKSDTRDEDLTVTLKKIQRNKWIIFLVFMLGISFSGAEFVSA